MCSCACVELCYVCIYVTYIYSLLPCQLDFMIIYFSHVFITLSLIFVRGWVHRHALLLCVRGTSVCTRAEFMLYNTICVCLCGDDCAAHAGGMCALLSECCLFKVLLSALF